MYCYLCIYSCTGVENTFLGFTNAQVIKCQQSVSSACCHSLRAETGDAKFPWQWWEIKPAHAAPGRSRSENTRGFNDATENAGNYRYKNKSGEEFHPESGAHLRCSYSCCWCCSSDANIIRGIKRICRTHFPLFRSDVTLIITHALPPGGQRRGEPDAEVEPEVAKTQIKILWNWYNKIENAFMH